MLSFYFLYDFYKILICSTQYFSGIVEFHFENLSDEAGERGREVFSLLITKYMECKVTQPITKCEKTPKCRSFPYDFLAFEAFWWKNIENEICAKRIAPWTFLQLWLVAFFCFLNSSTCQNGVEHFERGLWPHVKWFPDQKTLLNTQILTK